MTRFMVRRVFAAVAVLIGVYTVTFALIRVTPGSPFASRSIRPLPPEVQQAIEARYGLDDPMVVQYVRNLFRLAIGDFGPSFQREGRTVWELIGPTLATTASLIAAALVVGLLVGLCAGLIAGLRPGGTVDRFVTVTSSVFISLPVFAVAGVLVAVFAVQFGLVPASGWNGVLSTSAIIPVVCLALDPAAVMARFTRSTVVEIMHQDFIRTVQGHGLPRRRILANHVVRNALPGLFPVAAIEVAVVTGSVAAVEVVMNIDGAGRALISALVGRDFPTVMALTLIAACVIVAANLMSDVARGWLDPRLRGDSR